MNKPQDRPVLAFTTGKAWRSWLRSNHSASDGIWLRIFKKASAVKTVTYAEALDEALCFGWIDAKKRSFDDESYLQLFTPRRPKSVWSKRNREHVTRLVKENRMTAAGSAQVDAAKADGRWDDAYDPPSTMEVPEDFIALLRKHKNAYAFYKTLTKTNRYAIAVRLRTAKRPETRERRVRSILEMLKKGEKLH